jgi:hypothetical protein
MAAYDEHDMGKSTNGGTDTDSLESTNLSIGTDRTPEGNHIGEESEHVDESRRYHTTLS